MTTPYDKLNPEQLRAVLHDKGPLLILAGAGSGKTRVLTHRIAYLMEERGVNPYHILAITFTNKAAKEMRNRVDNLVGYGAENVFVSTFHSMAVRFLRRDIEALGYSSSFTIYDTDDQKTLMHEICKFLDIDTKVTKERTLLNAISSAKDDLITPEEYDLRALGDYNKQRIARVYREYQKRLKQNNALDFDDLIFKTVELFQTNPSVLAKYQNRFRYIMVDEYQDTNTAQFELIRLLATTQNEEGRIEHNLCVVGDDDQSIYKFRGANIRNILDFEKQYPDTVVIRLEQNYRSTKAILQAANEVIHNNVYRKDKTLWTENAEGAPIFFTKFDTDYAEASAIASNIAEQVKDKYTYNDIAILFRTNAQSRVLEEKLVMKGIPYKLVGGINFYQRREIKDILSYLKTIDNGADSIALKRILNVPKRGIGLTTIDKLTTYSQEGSISFFGALERVEYMSSINTSTKEKIQKFVSLIQAMRRNIALPDYSIKNLIDDIMELTGYSAFLEEQSETKEEFNDRIQNINELINKAVSFEEESDEPVTLQSFLEEVALVADIDELDASSEQVVLMTLHSAKGLEFPYVYICGMEEGIFPSYLSINADDPEAEVEEERRLCYVGITRAKEGLSLSAARQRMIRGETQFNKPSRFITEIPRYLLSERDDTPYKYIADERYPKSILKTAATAPLPPVKQFGSAQLAKLDFEVGDSVRHLKFGVGTVTAITKGGKDFEVTVHFPDIGDRKMLASFAKLQKC